MYHQKFKEIIRTTVLDYLPNLFPLGLWEDYISYPLAARWGLVTSLGQLVMSKCDHLNSWLTVSSS